MRIISGKYKGRVLEGFNIEGTRPTMDRVKESFIASIQLKLKNSVILDLFAGSGSVGFEMISNGASEGYFVDTNKIVIDTLNKNVKKLNPSEKITILKKDFKDALKYFYDNNIKFDIIFLDPPYKLNYVNPALELIKKYNLLNKDGIIICEVENEVVNNLSFEITKEKKYGSKNVIFLKNNG